MKKLTLLFTLACIASFAQSSYTLIQTPLAAPAPGSTVHPQIVVTSASGITAGNWTEQKANLATAGGLQMTGVATAALPACNAATAGTTWVVNDANANTFHTTLAGGGSTVTPVFCTGTTWIID